MRLPLLVVYLVVEKELPALSNGEPKCRFITGKGCCPPEDVGGIYGYDHLRSVIENPKNPEYNIFTKWLEDKTIQCIKDNVMQYSPEEINALIEDIE